MNTTIRTLATGVAACLTLALAGSTLGAQDTIQRDRPIDAVGFQADARFGADAALLGQPQVEAALRAHGFRANRLSRTETRALERTYAELFPDANPRRVRLNRTQANALVYMALVEPDDRGRGGGRGGFTGGPGCESTAILVYELGDLVSDGERGRALFLSRDEQQELRNGARDLERAASRCGSRQLADEASRLHTLAGERMVERDRVLRQIRTMKSIVRGGGMAGRF